ncbi:MAG: sodium:solute symporter [Firmicutes bacterium]|nr:sodium:solute symporter [Bacillota bacterium]
MAIKVGMLVFFFAVMVAVGVYCRKNSQDVDGFVLGGRSVGPWLTAFAYGTSYFSAVIFIGYAGQFGWKYGISATWIGLGNAIIGSFLAWAILGRRTRLMTQHLNSATMPEFFGKRFACDKLKVAASAIIFIFLIPYTASLYNGLSRLFGMAFGVDYAWCVLGMATLTCIYVLLGGYMATVINDFIQGIIMLGGIVAVVYAVLASNGGLMQALSTLSAIPCETNPTLSGAFVSFFSPQPLHLLGVVILTSLGTWGLPQMVGKFYAIKNEQAIQKGTVISTLFAFVVAGGCYFLGGFGRLYSGDIEYAANGTPIYDSIVPQMLSHLPDLMIAVVVILVLSASMSTLSSLVLTSGSTLTLDVIVPLRRGQMSEKSKMLCIRALVVFFIVISSLIAIVQAKSSVTFIAQLMGISWGALAGAFLGPFLYALYWRKTSRAAVWSSFALSLIIMCGNMFCNFTGRIFINPYFASPINAGMLAMIVSLIVVPLVSLLGTRQDKKSVDAMFACYERSVVVNAATALGREND